MKRLLISLLVISVSLFIFLPSDANCQTTLTVWQGAIGDGAWYMEESVVNDYEQLNPDTCIEMLYVPSGEMTVQKLLIASAAGTTPDALLLAWPQYIGPIRNLIYTLDGFIADYPDEWDEADFLDGLLDGNCRFDGVTYGVPFETNNLALYYNKELLGEANVTPPTTWDELVLASRVLTDRDEGIWGLYWPVTRGENLSWRWQCFLEQAGGNMTNAEGTDLLFNSDAGRAALTLFVDLINLYKAVDPAPATNAFLNGKAAMSVQGPWDIPDYLDAGLDFGIAPLPAGPVNASTGNGGTINVIIKSDPAHEKAAWDFLMWLASPDVIVDFAIGYGSIPVRKSAASIDAWQSFIAEIP